MQKGDKELGTASNFYQRKATSIRTHKHCAFKGYSLVMHNKINNCGYSQHARICYNKRDRVVIVVKPNNQQLVQILNIPSVSYFPVLLRNNIIFSIICYVNKSQLSQYVSDEWNPMNSCHTN